LATSATDLSNGNTTMDARHLEQKMNFGYEGRFVHASTNGSKLTVSVCIGCLKPVAHSPEPERLMASEKAHKCYKPILVKKPHSH